MANQLTEYRQRHGIKSICPANEGLLFLESKKQSPLICLTSSHLKCVSPCQICISHQDLISIELFQGDVFPQSLTRIAHSHIVPDGDVLSFIESKYGSDDYVPYASKGERDQEKWIWNFFLRSRPFLGNTAWNRFRKQQKAEKCNPEMEWIEQVDWIQQHFDDHFQIFYQNVYSVCMIGRKYLLLN